MKDNRKIMKTSHEDNYEPDCSSTTGFFKFTCSKKSQPINTRQDLHMITQCIIVYGIHGRIKVAATGSSLFMKIWAQIGEAVVDETVQVGGVDITFMLTQGQILGDKSHGRIVHVLDNRTTISIVDGGFREEFLVEILVDHDEYVFCLVVADHDVHYNGGILKENKNRERE